MTKEEVEQEIRNVRRQLVRSMNGVVAHRMQQAEISYKKNYGVELPRLSQIATTLPHDVQLAKALWQLSIRETMLLSLMICPIENFSIDEFRTWIKQIPNYEIAELASQKLFSRLPFAFEQALLLLEGEAFEPICAFLIASKKTSEMSDDIANLFKNKALEFLRIPDLFSAILVFFRSFVQHKKSLCTDLLVRIESVKDSSPRATLLYEEVKTQLEFS